MSKMKLKETSFLGVALAMSVSGLEVPAHAAGLPQAGAGITMNDFGQIEGFASLTHADGTVTQGLTTKKGCSKKGIVCGTGSDDGYGDDGYGTDDGYGSSTSGGSSKKGSSKKGSGSSATGDDDYYTASGGDSSKKGSRLRTH